MQQPIRGMRDSSGLVRMAVPGACSQVVEPAAAGRTVILLMPSTVSVGHWQLATRFRMPASPSHPRCCVVPVELYG